MLLLRVVDNYNHFKPGQVNRQQVLSALTDEFDLSVFEVDDHTVRRVAVLFAMGGRRSPSEVNYILLPDEWLAELEIKPVRRPSDIKHPLLQQTHHELPGLDDAKREAILKLIESRGCTHVRISKPEVLRVAKSELDDHACGYFAKQILLPESTWIAKIDALGANN